MSLQREEKQYTSKERKWRPSFLIPGLFAALLAASALLLPLLLGPTQIQPAQARVGRDRDVSTEVGTAAFLSSGQVDQGLTQGYNDLLTLNFHSLPTPPAGLTYYAWLMPDPADDVTPPLLLGILHPEQTKQVTLTYASPSHTNLLASYSGVRITEQPGGTPPSLPSQDPATWRWQGWIPNIPTPGDENHYSLLSHLRHLLAKDPTLEANNLPGGLALWLTRNVTKVEEWVSAAQGSWQGAQTSPEEADFLHRQMVSILEYLDGQSYAWLDLPAGSPWLVDQAGGKIGLIDRVQNQTPPAYLEHVDLHLEGLANAPGHTATQQQLALLVDRVTTRMEADLQQVRTDARALVKMNATQLRQAGNLALLDEMARLSLEVTSGWFDPQTGENIGGVLWIMERLQQLATIPITSVQQSEKSNPDERP